MLGSTVRLIISTTAMWWWWRSADNPGLLRRNSLDYGQMATLWKFDCSEWILNRVIKVSFGTAPCWFHIENCCVFSTAEPSRAVERPFLFTCVFMSIFMMKQVSCTSSYVWCWTSMTSSSLANDQMWLLADFDMSAVWYCKFWYLPSLPSKYLASITNISADDFTF